MLPLRYSGFFFFLIGLHVHLCCKLSYSYPTSVSLEDTLVIMLSRDFLLQQLPFFWKLLKIFYGGNVIIGIYLYKILLKLQHRW